MKTNLIKKITASIVLAHMFSFSFFGNTFAAVSPVTITFTDNVAVGPVQSDTLNISVSGTSGSPTYLYAFSSTNSVCNGGDFNGTTYSFTPGSSFTITNSLNNGKYVCIQVNIGSSKTYAKSSNALNINTPPLITITDDVSAGPVRVETVSANITDTDIVSRKYSLSSDIVCNGSDSWLTYTNGALLTFNSEVENGKYICFRGTDTLGNIYQVSSNPLKIDTSLPLITLNGTSPLSVEIGSNYTDDGAVFNDNMDGTGVLIASGTVNSNTLGDYTLTYSYTDRAGNKALPVTRTIRVVDTGAPLITLNGSGTLYVEGGTIYTDSGAIASDNYDTPVSVVGTGVVNTGIVGSYTLTYKHTDTNGNEALPVIRTVNVIDTTKPVLTLIGSGSIDVEIGTVFSDFGAMLNDNIDTSTLVMGSGIVNTELVGSYSLTYSYTDRAGNQAFPLTRTVNVVDTTKPLLTLNGDAVVTVNVGEVYEDAGVEALDDFYGDISGKVIVDGLPIDTSGTGSYTISYNVTDQNGNKAFPVMRTVNVVDTEIPVISLNGEGNLILEVGTLYEDAGATALDNLDGDITSKIVVNSNLDTKQLGKYTITYDVSDLSGNSAFTVTRYILIVDTTKPIISLNGTSSGQVLRYSTYTDSGATAFDNFDQDITANITSLGSVDTETLGLYTISYDVSDSNSNMADTVLRTIEGITGEIPLITLSGSEDITREVFSSYTDSGATATDREDGDITDKIVVNNPVNTEMLGTYTIRYNVTDSNRNPSREQIRKVHIVDTTKPIITLNGTGALSILVGSNYTDSGAIASDNYDGDIKNRIIQTGSVNTRVVGSYTLSYSVQDSHENTALPVQRTVNVVAGNPPLMTLVGDALININVGTLYTDSGASASDVEDGNISEKIVVNNPVNTSVAGTYTITYSVLDSSGNSALPVTRTVNVNSLPVIDTGSSSGGGGSSGGTKHHTPIPQVVKKLETIVEEDFVVGSNQIQEESPETSACGIPYTDGFNDINTSFAKLYIENLAKKGAINGQNKLFSPERAITRAEFLKMLLKAHCIDFSTEDTSKLLFTDGKKGDWKTKVSHKAAKLGIANGYDDGSFQGDKAVSRIEAIKFILKLKKLPLDTSPELIFGDIETPWMIPYANSSEKYGIIDGNSQGALNRFLPNISMTRAEAAKVIWQSVDTGL